MSRTERIFNFHGGLRNKAQKIVEEAGEVAIAIVDFIYWEDMGDCNGAKAGVRKSLVKELADNDLVKDQIMLGAGITQEEIDAEKELKKIREIKRIEGGYYK